MRYDAVIFDLFGTLVDGVTADDQARVLGWMSDTLGVPKDGFARLWDATRIDRMVGRFRTTAANIDQVCRGLDIRPAPEKLAAAVDIRVDWTRRLLTPRPGVTGTLRTIRAGGLRTGLITDCSLEVPLVWRDSALAELVDAAAFSSQEGIRKPDRRLYERVCRRLQVDPPRCLYVGDGGGRELTGAAELGMEAVQLRTASDPADVLRFDVEEWAGRAISSVPEVLELLH